MENETNNNLLLKNEDIFEAVEKSAMLDNSGADKVLDRTLFSRNPPVSRR